MNQVAQFSTRLNICTHLARRYPNWTGMSELRPHLTGHERTHQRVIRSLIDGGYIERGGQTPIGYRIIPSKFQEFKAL